LGEADLLRARELVAAAVGLQTDRGDVLAIHSADALGHSGSVTTPVANPVNAETLAVPAKGPSASDRPRHGSELFNVPSALALALATAMMLIALAVVYRSRRAAAGAGASSPTGHELNAQEREVLLQQLRQWLGNPEQRNQGTSL
jgi:hypothetical protein